MYLQVSTTNLDNFVKGLCLGGKSTAKVRQSRDEAVAEFVNGSNVHCGGEPEHQ